MQIRTDTLGRRCQWLGAGIGALWLLTVLPARHFFGTAGIEAAAVSAVCCLLAGCVTFLFAARFTQPRMQAFAVLFGTAVRGVFALAGALLMQFVLGLVHENYLIWLGVFYLVALALETALMLGPPGNAGIR
jgi:hypothetical protein